MSAPVTTPPTLHRQGIGDLLRRSALRAPGAVALVDGGRSWTYAELAADASAAACGLAGLGVVKGDRVLVLGRNSAEYAIAWLAVQLLGAAHVPVNYMLGAREVAYVLGHSGASVALVDPGLRETLDAAVADCGSARACSSSATTSGPSGTARRSCPTSPSTRPTSPRSPTRAAPSRPRRARCSPTSGLIAQYVSCIVAGEYSASDVLLHALPLYHCAQMHCFLMPGLYLGTKNVIVGAATPKEMLGAVVDHGITSIFAPPTVWIGLLRSPASTRRGSAR